MCFLCQRDLIIIISTIVLFANIASSFLLFEQQILVDNAKIAVGILVMILILI